MERFDIEVVTLLVVVVEDSGDDVVVDDKDPHDIHEHVETYDGFKLGTL